MAKNKPSALAIENKKTLHRNLDFAATEQYKLLRTNLEFTLPEGVKCPVIGVTSSMRGEGKSTTAVNLSYVLAEKGSRVVLIDGDLRLPSISKKMSIPLTPGLTDLLMGNSINANEFQSELLKNWYIIPAGNVPPNPSELLGGKRMENIVEKLKGMFDYIVIDLPPVNLVSDAVSVAGLLDGTIVVIREDHTEKKELERCLRQLKLANHNILGCVLNGSKTEGGKYSKYNSKYYKNSKYYQSDDEDEN